MTQGGRQRGRAAVDGVVHGAGRCGAPPGSGSPLVDAVSSFEDGLGVRRVRGLTAVSNCSENRLPVAAVPEAIPVRLWWRTRAAGSGTVLGSGRSCCGGLSGLGCDRAGRLRRRRALFRCGVSGAAAARVWWLWGAKDEA